MKLVQVLTLILFVAFLTVSISRCTKFDENQTTRNTIDRPDQESWDSQIIITKNGRKKAVVNTRHLRQFSGKNEIIMNEGVEADFFDENQSHISHLTSEMAVVKEKTNDMIAMGNVVVVSDSGATLYTERLRWEHESELIKSDTLVTITTEKDTLHGVGLVSDTKLENWTILKPTGTTVREINLEKNEETGKEEL